MASQVVTKRKLEGVSATTSRALQIIGCALLGAVIIYGAGFVNTAAVHNAAHDTRHSQGFLVIDWLTMVRATAIIGRSHF